MMYSQLLVLIACVSFFSAAKAVPVLPDVLHQLINDLKPLLQDQAISQLPQTYGNCRENNAPKPCSGSGNLYYKKSTWYKIKARWITGLKQVTIQDLSVANHGGSKDIMLRAQLRFRNLPLSLRAEGCIKWIGCAKIFDNASSCCGPNRVVSIAIKARCHEAKPFLRNVGVHDVSISPSIKIQPKIFGKFKVNVKDITSDVERELEDVAGDFLTSNLIKDANNLVSQLYGDKVKCTK